MIVAVVPAAGRSERMGRPKLVLPLDDSTVIERVVRTLRAGGVDRVLVVAGPHVPQLVDLARSAGADVCQLTEPTPDMRATVERGLDWIERHYSPDAADAWLLAPADHPCLDAEAVRAVCKPTGSDAAASIVVPTWEGKRGHPVFFRWSHAAGVRALPGGVGINAYLREHQGETREVAVESRGILQDLDTPDDYRTLVEQPRV